MNYGNYNDNELLLYVRECNEDASELLFKKYEPMIKNIASKMYLYCKDSELELCDLEQEGMLAFNNAINCYNDNYGKTFTLYVKKCIVSKLISVIISTKRKKRLAINTSVSFEDILETPYKIDNLLSDNSLNPENIIAENEQINHLRCLLLDVLTDFEQQVLELKISGLTYKEISILLDKDVKAIDNALQRMRFKLKKHIKKFSLNYCL